MDTRNDTLHFALTFFQCLLSWYKVKSHNPFQFVCLRVVLCTQDISHFIAMQHETLCRHINVGCPRASASLNTSHKPFTTWWGKLLPLRRVPRTVSSIIACLSTNCWKGLHTTSCIICFFPHSLSLFFFLLSLVLKAIPAPINLVNWATVRKRVSVTYENLILNQNTLSHVSFRCNYMCITRQQTLQNPLSVRSFSLLCLIP